MSCPPVEELALLAEKGLSATARARALEHVESCQGCRQVVAALVGGSASTHQGPPEAWADVPPVLGRYRVVRELGRGAMGRVFEAEDTLLHRTVALKLAHADSDDAEQLAQMTREAQAIAQVQHPNVVALFDVVQHDGWLFLAMEHVQGQNLRQWLAQKPRAVREILAVFAEAASGLHAAHRARVVHQDFKPENVLIGQDGRVRVADFGLAASAVPDSTGATPPEGGTPAYMAPERASPGPVDARADQYSFCVALYEALYGRRPFTSPGELLPSAGANPRPSFPSRSGVPRRVRALLSRGLCADPGGRFADLAELRARLVTPSIRRGHLVLGTAAAALLAVIGSLGWQRVARARRCRQVAAQLDQLWNAEKRARLSEALGPNHGPVVALVDRFAKQWAESAARTCQAEESAEGPQQVACLWARREELRTSLELALAGGAQAKTRAYELMNGLGSPRACEDRTSATEPAVPADPALRAKTEPVDQQLARVKALERSGKYNDARDLARHALNEARAIGFPPQVAHAAWRLGRAATLAGDFVTAQEPLTECTEVAIRARLPGQEAACWVARVLLCGSADNLDRCAEVLQLARAAVERAGPDRFTETDLLLALDAAAANLAWAQGHFSEAYTHFQSAHERAKLLGEAYRFVGGLATNAAQMGRFAEAQTLLREHLEWCKKNLGPDHTYVGRAGYQLAVIYYQLGRFKEALPLFEASLHNQEHTLGEDHLYVHFALNGLGRTQTRLGMLDEGARSLRRELELRARKGVTRDHSLVHPHLGLGENAFARGDYREALDQFSQAAELSVLSQGQEHVITLQARVELASSLVRLGRPDEAARTLRPALASLRKLPDARSWDLARALESMAALERSTKHLLDSLQYAQEALLECEKADNPACRASAHLEQAKTLWALERRDEARNHAALAEKLLLETGVDSATLQDARQLLRK